MTTNEFKTNELKTSIDAAKAAGETRYAGDECPKGHGNVRYTSTGGCVVCHQLAKEKHRLAKRGGRPAKQSRSPDEPVTMAWIKSNCIVTERGCWEWQKSRNEDGYGWLWYQRKMRKAHSVSFELSGGELIPGGVVMHACDHRPCCNPEHLSAGFQRDNNADMKMKGRARAPQGEASPVSLLTEDQVVRIREMLPYKAATEIAVEFGVHPTTIYCIKHGKTWTHVPVDPSIPVVPVTPRQPIEQAVEQVAQIKAALAAGKPGSVIAVEFGVSKQKVSSIKLGNRWANVQPATTREAA